MKSTIEHNEGTAKAQSKSTVLMIKPEDIRGKSSFTLMSVLGI
jgi:hypothetical protein